jgi:sigma-E factor negative regulatory protein RseB
LFTLLLALAGPLHAAGAEAWLAKIAPALRDLDYQGTLVYVAGGKVETLRVFHRNDAGRERERLVAISGPPREVVRDGSQVMCIGTGQATVAYDLRQAGRWSQALAISEAAQSAGYRAALAGEGRVAGHAAQVIEVQATDRWRYGYRLWIERKTGLPLRVDLLGDDGVAVEQVSFTELQLGQRPADADLQASSGAIMRRIETLAAPDEAPPQWQVPAPPAGYELRAARYRAEGVQLLYSDGLASVSVYIERAGDGLHGASARQRGAVNARSFWFDGWHVLAIGKVPAATVDRFARTVRAVDGDG